MHEHDTEPMPPMICALCETPIPLKLVSMEEDTEGLTVTWQVTEHACPRNN